MATAAVQLNNPVKEITVRMPVELYSPRRLTFTGLKVLGATYSFSVQKDGKLDYYTRKPKLIAAELNISESSARRALRVGEELGYIKGQEGRKYAYQFDVENNHVSGGHYRLEAWMTKPIVFDDGYTVVLTPLEQNLLALFNSECNRKPQEYSDSDLAGILGACRPMIQSAITKFNDKEHKLVYRRKIGVNGYRKSEYIINSKLFRKLNKAEEKKQKAIEKAIAAKQNDKPEKPAQGSTELKEALEREYYERKNYRAECVSKALARARADETFRASEIELRRLAPKLAAATVRKLPELAKLQAAEQELQTRRLTALERLGIDEKELSEDFYVRCPKCRDMLFMPNGSVCSCFRRGSPPGDDNV